MHVGTRQRNSSLPNILPIQFLQTITKPKIPHPSVRYILHYEAIPFKSAGALSFNDWLKPYHRTPLILVKRMTPYFDSLLTRDIIRGSIQSRRGII